MKVELDWVDSQIFEQPDAVTRLEGVHGILVPGGFGERGTEGKIEAVRFARERERAVLRHLLRHADGGDRGGAPSRRALPDASSTEFGPCDEPVVGLLTEWARGNEIERRAEGGDLGGTMRLGAYPALLADGSLVRGIYGSRRRSPSATAIATRSTSTTASGWRTPGLRFSGMSPDGVLPEIDRTARPSLVRRRAVPSRS